MEKNSTKIVCTIGPASASQAVLRDVLKSGMNVARINFSHGSYDSNLELLEKVRTAAAAAKKPVAILLDLQGPKIRVGALPPEGLELVEGHMATLHAGVTNTKPGAIPVPYDRLAHDVQRGDRLLLDDGTRELEVLDVKGSIIRTKVIIGGRLLSHKGINVPSVTLSVESLTEKDLQDLEFGLKQNIDFVALSFVRTAQDVQQLREKIKEFLPKRVEPPAIIVKIEKHEALDNFDGILAETDGVMVARGDLGLETPATKVPLRQKELIAKCLVAGKPVIIATQMLDSMQKSPRPTRAEVSDVANAVIDHTDAVMLSGETAMGQYPREAVKTMSEIIQHTEESSLDTLRPHSDGRGDTVPFSVAAAAVELAQRIGAAALLVTTRSGYSARAVARFRPEIPIFAATDSFRTAQQLLLSWGVRPLEIDGYDDQEKMAASALKYIRKTENMAEGTKVVVVAGLKRRGGFDSAIRVVEL
jgi:pyruvate kinase